MSAQVTTAHHPPASLHNGGATRTAVPSASPPPPRLLLTAPPPGIASPTPTPPSPFSTSAKHRLLDSPEPSATSPLPPLSSTTPARMMKTELRNVDDGVDLSYDRQHHHHQHQHQLQLFEAIKNEGAAMTATAGSPIKQEVHIKSEMVETHLGNSAGTTTTSSSQLQRSGISLGSGGGRLKFFKEGRVLLELTHRCAGEGEKVSWVPTGNKKVYWPPGPPASLSSRVDSTASNNTVTGSDGSSELTSPSPWGGQQTPSPSAPWPSLTPTTTATVPCNRAPHRLKSTPRRLDISTDSLLAPFAMKPLEGIRRYRRKLRAYRRKCRQQPADFKIGAFVLRMECQSAASQPRTARKLIKRSCGAASGRLEKILARLSARQSAIHVPISAWRPGRTDLVNLVMKGGGSSNGGPPSCPGSPHHLGGGTGIPVRTVKSELKMVTETCTLPVTSLITTSPRYSSQKVKAETRTVTAATRNIPVRTLPITPTVARVKAEPAASSPESRLKASTALTSLLSPEIARVRMEIGPMSPDYSHQPYYPREGGAQSFVSPRKRYLRDYEPPSPGSLGNGGAGPSPAKHRRLSTDHHNQQQHKQQRHGSTDSNDRSSPAAYYRSGGSGSSAPTPQSPFRPSPMSPQHHSGAFSSASPRQKFSGVGGSSSSAFSSFSIDSLMSHSGAGSNSEPSPASPRGGSSVAVKRESTAGTIFVPVPVKREEGGGPHHHNLHHHHHRRDSDVTAFGGGGSPARPASRSGNQSVSAALASSPFAPSRHSAATTPPPPSQSQPSSHSSTSYPTMFPPYSPYAPPHPLLAAHQAAAAALMDPRLAAQLAAYPFAAASGLFGSASPFAAAAAAAASSPYLSAAYAAAAAAANNAAAAAAAAAAAPPPSQHTNNGLPSSSTSSVIPPPLPPVPLGVSGSVWTPPVATPTPPPSMLATMERTPQKQEPQSPAQQRHPVYHQSAEYNPTGSSMTGDVGSGRPAYGQSEREALPAAAHQDNYRGSQQQPMHTHQQKRPPTSDSVDDAPLNLCMRKPTTL